MSRGEVIVQISTFGMMEDGTAIKIFALKNSSGFSAKIITYGATLQSLSVPDRHGKFDDIVLGFDNLEGYLGVHPYFGSTIGRFANRIANGKFALDGKDYALTLNDGPNSLHGGLHGFDRKVWEAEATKNQDFASVRLSYLSRDGEEGFPGTLKIAVVYSLTDENQLKIDYTATTDKATPLNLTNHSYFNLAAAGGVLNHCVYLNAGNYTPVNKSLIPTGEILPTQGTPFDFSKATVIGPRIAQLTDDLNGYDHNFVLKGEISKLKLAARLSEPVSGRQMEVCTTEPGMQFYTGNFLDGKVVGKGGLPYQKHDALCLEAQHFPDSVNHPNFPTAILRPGDVYRQETIYTFSTNKSGC